MVPILRWFGTHIHAIEISALVSIAYIRGGVREVGIPTHLAVGTIHFGALEITKWMVRVNGGEQPAVEKGYQNNDFSMDFRRFLQQQPAD